jgi:hypothetical protein
MNYLFLHLSTTTIDISRAEILEMAAVYANSEEAVLSTYYDKIKPEKEVEHCEHVAEFGYSQGAWNDAIDFSSGLSTLSHTCLSTREPFVVVCHWAEVQKPIFFRTCNRIGIENPLSGPAWICTGQLSWPMQVAQMIRNRQVASLCRYWGVDPPEMYGASAVALAVKDVYFRMMARYLAPLEIEHGVRSIGGGLVQQLLEQVGL